LIACDVRKAVKRELKMAKSITGSILFLLLLVSCTRQDELKIQAEQLAQSVIIVDTHIDTPYRLSTRQEDISGKTTGNFNYPMARKGGLNVPFMSIYIPSEREDLGTANSLADSLIDLVESIASTWPDKFALAKSVADVYSNFSQGKISLAMGMENAAPVAGDLANLAYFYRRGIRYITLTHAKSNHICDSSYDPDRQWNGLSPFGREVVKEMNRLGIMIDISHVTDSTFYQVLSLSRTPLIASHSSCRKFTPGWERNMSDDMIKAMAAKGGVIQINFGSSFINDHWRKTYEPLWNYIEEKNLKFSDPGTLEYIRNFKKEHPADYADITEVIDHIEHVVNIAGIDHVGFGSDFDGVGDSLPDGLKDVSGYPNLIYELLKRGYSEEAITKICSGNLLRVWSEVENFAARAFSQI